MARRNERVYALVFATAIAAVLGVVVSTAANVLAPRIAANKELERKKNVLIATRLLAPDDSPGRAEIRQMYKARIVEHRVGDERLPMFTAVDASGATTALCIPVAGRGLWGPIRGYLALAANEPRVLRVTFYEHRETPGLGAEISSTRWTERWVGKWVASANGTLASIRVKKTPVDANDPADVRHAVDAVSGATITSRAVESLVRAGLKTYWPHLEARWRTN